MNREQFLEYMDHFNHKRWDKVTSYFCPDVTLEYPDNFTGPNTPGRTLHGPQEFIDNYQALTSNVKEVLNLGVYLYQGSNICVELITEFEAYRDHSGASPTVWKKGEVKIMNQCVIYDLDEKGKFKRIRIFHHRHLDPKTVKLH